MIKETGLTAVVSGSLAKFYPEIMRTIEEFRDLGVEVLDPPYRSWIYVPPQRILTPKDVSFRPLLGEEHKSVRQIEDGFLAHIAMAHIAYIENPEGYLGSSTSMELGFAIALATSGEFPLIASREPLASNLELKIMFSQVVEQIQALSPTEVVEKLKKE